MEAGLGDIAGQSVRKGGRMSRGMECQRDLQYHHTSGWVIKGWNSGSSSLHNNSRSSVMRAERRPSAKSRIIMCWYYLSKEM